MTNNSFDPKYDPFEAHVNANPTYRFFLREAKLDYKIFNHQVDIMFAVAKIAISEYIDKKY